jgi:error-prone DNA polymerase
VTFLNLEDETGLVNVVCSKGAWKRYRQAAQTAPAVIVRGRLERYSDVINVVADKIDVLPIAARGIASRDFR